MILLEHLFYLFVLTNFCGFYLLHLHKSPNNDTIVSAMGNIPKGHICFRFIQRYIIFELLSGFFVMFAIKTCVHFGQVAEKIQLFVLNLEKNYHLRLLVFRAI